MSGDAGFDWKTEYSVGHLGLDGEHRYFVELVNRLSYIMAANPQRQDILELLLILESETEIHFQHEEDILKLTGYPSVRDHAEKHRQLLEAIVLARHAVEKRTETDIAVEAPRIGELRQLLFEHILSEDMAIRNQFSRG